MNAFFVPHSFLTAILQNHSRKYAIPAEKLKFSVTIMDGLNEADIEEGPKDGVYIHGLNIEGARWDSENKCIAHQLPGKTIEELPIIHLLPE